MQDGVFPCIKSQVKCHNFCRFKDNVNFVSSCRMETQVGKSCLAILSKSLSACCCERVMQYTVLCEVTALYK